MEAMTTNDAVYLRAYPPSVEGNHDARARPGRRFGDHQ